MPASHRRRQARTWIGDRRVLGTALTVLLLLGAVACSDANTPPGPNSALSVSVPKGRPLGVAFIGDSLDQGLYATSRPRGFHALVVEGWAQSGPLVDAPPLGGGGGTVAGVLAKDRPLARQDVYIVELGTNDILRHSPQKFRTDYSQLLDRIHRSAPDGRLICVGLWRPRAESLQYDVIVGDTCATRGGAFIGISDLKDDPALSGPPGRPTDFGLSDAFHPNDAGHAAIARRVLSALTVTRN